MDDHEGYLDRAPWRVVILRNLQPTAFHRKERLAGIERASDLP
jgi:hypothetical protein